jgi:hypothetical protein
MGSITLNFANDLNVSLQKNTDDAVFFQDTSNNIYQIGNCTDITNNSITCNIADNALRPTAGDFIFFAKNREINTSGLLGYYAEVDVEVTSNQFKELFAVNTEVSLSS